MQTFTFLSIVIAMAMVVQIDAASVTFYQDARYNNQGGGPSETVDIGSDCHNFYTFGDITALDTRGACIWCFQNLNCLGRARKLTPDSNECSHWDLTSCAFNDVITSCKLC